MKLIGYLAGPDGARLMDVAENADGTVTLGQDDTFACLGDALDSLCPGYTVVGVGLAEGGGELSR